VDTTAPDHQHPKGGEHQLATIHVDPEVYIALATHRDDLSRARNREVSFDEVVLDLLDRFRSGSRPTASDDHSAHPPPTTRRDAPRATATAAVTTRATATATR